MICASCSMLGSLVLYFEVRFSFLLVIFFKVRLSLPFALRLSIYCFFGLFFLRIGSLCYLSLYQTIYATLNGLRIARHNAAAHQLTNLLKSNAYTRHLTLINAGNQHGNHQDNTIRQWILRCTCSTTQCECLAKLRLDIIYIQGVAYEQKGPLKLTPDLTIQIIEFTFTHDRFLDHAIQTKKDKYNSL